MAVAFGSSYTANASRSCVNCCALSATVRTPLELAEPLSGTPAGSVHSMAATCSSKYLVWKLSLSVRTCASTVIASLKLQRYAVPLPKPLPCTVTAVPPCTGPHAGTLAEARGTSW